MANWFTNLYDKIIRRKMNPNNPGKYSDKQFKKNKSVHLRFNPTGRAYFLDYALGQVLSQLDGQPPNNAKGEEDQYWRAYLGIDNQVPKYSDKQNATWEKETGTDYHVDRDYYTTTPRMDQDIQALADTMNLRRIVENYDELDKQYKFSGTKEHYIQLLDQAKQVMNSPNQWVQIDGDLTQSRRNSDAEKVQEYNPLGMLNSFGLMWNPKTQKLYMHDNYDFPASATLFSEVPRRPYPMKLRSAINYDPNKGAIILRSAENYNTQPASIAYKQGGKINYLNYFK